MAIVPLQLGGIGAMQPAAEAARLQQAAPVGFDSLLTAGVDKADGALKSADASLQAYAAGADIPVHEVMINMEQARLTLQFAVEVRNRLVEAYQEFMRMQV